MIPYGRQDITKADIDAVIEVLQSDFLTQGPMVPDFEKLVAQYCGATHAVAVNSATSALHIACLALGLSSGDLLWTSPITFVASANCGLYCGADVDFVDIDPVTYNMSIDSLVLKLEKAAVNGRLPKIVIPVHLCGQSCDMQAIYALSEQYGFSVIEDASHAIGGRYHEQPIGNCQYSDITIFSFHPVKIITTAEGGMALTNNSRLAERMDLLRSHGITRNSDLMTKEVDGPWYYQQIDLGFNYRMTEIQAALGISQIERLDCYVSRRHFLANRYNQLLGALPVVTPVQLSGVYSALHLYVILLPKDSANKHREVFEFLRANGVGVNLHYIPVHTQPYYESIGFRQGDYPNSEDYYTRAMSLPLYPGMTESDQDYIVNILQRALVV